MSYSKGVGAGAASFLRTESELHYNDAAKQHWLL
jgi:hypothetical protein